MFKYGFVLAVLLIGCHHELSGHDPFDLAVVPDLGPENPSAGPCGDLGQPCCVPVDPGPFCRAGLLCDDASMTCVAPVVPDMMAVADMSVPSMDLATPDDLSTPLDFSMQPDLMVLADLSTPLDFSAPLDFAVVADMSVPPDMTPPPPECDYNQNCTFSYGYWKQHWVCNWQSLTLGTVTYNHDQLLAILNQPVAGNELVALAYQLIGAKMNIVKGADPSSIQATIDAADALIGSLVVPPIGTGAFSSAADVATATSLADTLADFNLGKTGPGHCP